jgi:taurine dioxygenase
MGRASTATVRPVNPVIGAEILDVDLRDLDDATEDLIRTALREHHVVFFRDQQLDVFGQREFAARFGELQPFAFADPIDIRAPEAHALSTDGSGPKRSNADIWHTDATFMKCPPMGTVLRAVELPASGGDTLFANMFAAFDALSPRLRSLLDGMTATHDFTKSSSHRRPLHDEYPPVTHPVVRTHPESGRKALFVNRIFTTRLDGLTDRENETLLTFLCDHVRSPDFQCRFTWQPGSVAFWDNRSTQHYAVADYDGRRVMHRVVIAGDRPV